MKEEDLGLWIGQETDATLPTVSVYVSRSVVFPVASVPPEGLPGGAGRRSCDARTALARIDNARMQCFVFLSLDI